MSYRKSLNKFIFQNHTKHWHSQKEYTINNKSSGKAITFKKHNTINDNHLYEHMFN